AVTAKLDQPTTVSRNGLHVAQSSESASRVLSFPVSRPSSVRAPRWSRVAAIGLIGLAQAAALLLAIGLSWHAPVKFHPTDSRPSATIALEATPSLGSEVDVREGQVVLIRSEGAKVEVVNLTTPETPNGLDRLYLVHNEFESFSTSEVEVEEGQIL